MPTTDLLTVTIIGILAVMSPGPDTLIIVRNSLLYSKRVGLFTAMGITLGNMFWVLASLAGISILIAKTVLVFNIIKWIGAIYLIYIGLQAFKTRKTVSTDSANSNHLTRNTSQHLTLKQAFQIGLLTNLLNPKCALFFVSFFSVIVTPTTSIQWRCIYGFEISLIALTWFSILATVLSFSRIKMVFERFATTVERITGAILIILGVKLALYQK